ncbi:MAG: putative nickel-responsive regulator [Candidatus Woesearchaeota archaeon]|nr:putative nickel-responsive regulator [Candidatus Woesearchaeota archaeon]
MKSISLKIDNTFLEDINKTIKQNRYSTRTEFIREAIRDKIKQLEKEKAIRKLAFLKGSLNPKMSDDEAGKIAIKEIAKRFDLSLD